MLHPQAQTIILLSIVGLWVTQVQDGVVTVEVMVCKLCLGCYLVSLASVVAIDTIITHLLLFQVRHASGTYSVKFARLCFILFLGVF